MAIKHLRFLGNRALVAVVHFMAVIGINRRFCTNTDPEWSSSAATGQHIYLMLRLQIVRSWVRIDEKKKV